jgi:HPt (histidine-containing phosphotransfer) domain-containing protein
VHSLKSSAGGIGARHMSGLSANIEQLSRRGDAGPLPPLLAELEAAHARVKPRLAEARENIAP